MRISSEWLSEFVAVPAPEKLENLFLMAGIGVEERHNDRFELEVTSNRGDWLSVVGLAREIGAMTEVRSRVPAPDVEETGPNIEGRVRVEIENPADCCRYVARLIEGIKVGPSPDWMRERLEACGVRTHNLVVDVTNYVMLELGQPLHAFDADSLSGAPISVRRANVGEKLVTLDGAERELGPKNLLICDGETPIALAGVMGGQNTEVTEKTTRILLESAHFTPGVIRHSAYSAGLGSDASRRFERWVDPNGCKRAADRAAQLLASLGGGTVAEGAIDRYLAPAQDALVSLRPARCNAVLGLRIAPETQKSLLERLGFKVTQNGEELRAQIPTWRRDIEREIDLIEEIARLYGYDRVPTTLHAGTNPGAGRPLSSRLEDRARSALLRAGMTEFSTYSLSNEAAHTRAGESFEGAVRLRNPLSEDHTLLRTSLLPSLLEVLKRNKGRRMRGFELGKTYHAKNSAGELPDEKRVLGLALSDAPPPSHWQKSVAPNDFFALKAVVEHLFAEFGAPQPTFSPLKTASFHPGRAAALSVDGQDLGVLGEIHPDVADDWELGSRCYIALIDFDALVRHITLVKKYAAFTKFPASERDLALLVPQNLAASAVESAAKSSGGAILAEARIFDVYQGQNIPAGSKSLALALRFQAPDRTLTENEVKTAMDAILDAERALGAEIRG